MVRSAEKPRVWYGRLKNQDRTKRSMNRTFGSMFLNKKIGKSWKGFNQKELQNFFQVTTDDETHTSKPANTSHRPNCSMNTYRFSMRFDDEGTGMLQESVLASASAFFFSILLEEKRHSLLGKNTQSFLEGTV